MTKYLLKTDHFIGGHRYRKGETIDFDGKPSKSMAPVTKASKPAIETKASSGGTPNDASNPTTDAK